VTREAPLTAQQTSYYKKMLASFTFDVGQTRVSSVNAATQINKLLQISSGAVYAEDGSTVQFDVSNRLRVVQEAIEGANFKTLVFVPFRHTIDLLSAHLTKEGIINDVIDGRTPMAKRSIIIDDFQKTDNVQVLILQPQAAAHGITLTAADTTIWYAPVTSVETYLQANARIDRKGQKNAMTIVHVCGSKAEEKVYSMLAQNVSAHNALVDLYESIAQVGV
jgi:SNF2 family DNA or RNA helicase